MKKLIFLTIFSLGFLCFLTAKSYPNDLLQSSCSQTEELSQNFDFGLDEVDQCPCCADEDYFCSHYCDYWNYPYLQQDFCETPDLYHFFNLPSRYCECTCCDRIVWCEDYCNN